MAEYINPLKAHSEQKAEELNQGVEKYGVEYLIKINEQVNAMYEQRGLKTVDCKKIREEQENGGNDKE